MTATSYAVRLSLMLWPWEPVVELKPADLDSDDRCRDHVDNEAERWPPARVGDELTAVLPQILQPVGERPATSSHGEPVMAAAATTTNSDATPLSTAMTFGARQRLRSRCRRTQSPRSNRVDGGRWEPPERERRCRLKSSDDDPPDDGARSFMRSCCRSEAPSLETGAGARARGDRAMSHRPTVRRTPAKGPGVFASSGCGFPRRDRSKKALM